MVARAMIVVGCVLVAVGLATDHFNLALAGAVLAAVIAVLDDPGSDRRDS